MYEAFQSINQIYIVDAIIQSPSESLIPDIQGVGGAACLLNFDDQQYNAADKKYVSTWMQKLEVVVVHHSESGRLPYGWHRDPESPEAIFVFVRGMTRRLSAERRL